MGREYERKFLVSGDGWKSHVARTAEIVQGYIAITEASEVRVRVEGERAEITVKSRDAGVRRDEVNIPIEVSNARALLETFATETIAKTRHELDFAPQQWTVDVFHGPSQGLVLLEVEGTGLQSIRPPEWAVQDVTADPRFRNSYISSRPFGTWREQEGSTGVS